MRLQKRTWRLTTTHFLVYHCGLTLIIYEG
jgi:hypothetical protein